MDNIEIDHLLKGYPVTVCYADEVKMKRGHFLISNTVKSGERGQHWVVFYSPRRGPDEYFDSLGRGPEFYRVDFEKRLKRPYFMNCNQIQDSYSNVCGLYCVYYVMCRYRGQAMRDIVQPFNVRNKIMNDEYVVNFVNKNKP